MNPEKLFDGMGSIKEEYVASAAALLGYEKEDNMIPFTCKARGRRLRRSILIAAVITALLAATALGAYFAMSYRVPDAEETFRIRYAENPRDYIEWKDAKLAVTFPETDESRQIEIRPGWLPFDLPVTLPLSMPWSELTDETWFSRFSAESLCMKGGPNYRPEYADISQPLEIDLYSMAHFSNGGAMLLLYQTPGEIREEHWDHMGVDVLSFRTSQHFDARPEFNVPEYTLSYNYVVLSNAEAGWVIAIRGQLDMEVLMKVAKALEVRETGEILHCGDFDSRYVMFDGGVG